MKSFEENLPDLGVNSLQNAPEIRKRVLSHLVQSPQCSTASLWVWNCGSVSPPHPKKELMVLRRHVVGPLPLRRGSLGPLYSFTMSCISVHVSWGGGQGIIGITLINIAEWHFSLRCM